MKALLSLAVLLLFATQLSAGPIRSKVQSSGVHPQVSDQKFSFDAIENSTNAISQSEHEMHCNWTDGGAPCSSGSLFVPTAPVNPTPEPASLLLFGTLILGAIGVTKFKG